jgi:hypothetical protein
MFLTNRCEFDYTECQIIRLHRAQNLYMLGMRGDIKSNCISWIYHKRDYFINHTRQAIFQFCQFHHDTNFCIIKAHIKNLSSSPS